MRALAALSVTLAASATGCFIVAEDDTAPPPPYVSGSLIVDWSIDGRKDPGECRQGAVESISIVVETAYGTFVGEYEQACEAFATSIELEPGDYVADVVLLDPTGSERTTRIRVRPFQIYSYDTAVLPVDFPASSFY